MIALSSPLLLVATASALKHAACKPALVDAALRNEFRALFQKPFNLVFDCINWQSCARSPQGECRDAKSSPL